MEIRKESLSCLKVCRFCLSHEKSLQSIYDRSKETKKSVSLPLKILSSISVEVFPSDKMPIYICNRCVFFMDLCHEYKQICRQADETILQFIQSGHSLDTVTWPSSLTKMYRFATKSQPESNVVKTVVEGGATVEVTSHDISDSEGGDENVYNVKIEGTGENQGSTCIKIITNRENNNSPKITSKGSDFEGVATVSPVTKDRTSGGLTDGCWPCDECECTYSLQQLLELHKMQKHRARNISCEDCDAKFFSKYDLSTHQLRHSDETPFQCVACDKKFKRLVLLKRHEKIMHSNLPQHKCPYCPGSFLSLEELQAHQKRHTKVDRPFACSECGKKFPEKSILQRHVAMVHVQKPELSCEYCQQQFTSVTKLARHVRTHAGERAYPCKHCDKSFVKSHHYTRHLRLKHRDVMVADSRSGAGQAEGEYRCEQCNDTFSTQDDLIYHSAIHATRNLTCPLCKEKFENVDAVTAHIKSHANGMEFMCDFCELVFINKEKLDNHLQIAHEDEIEQNSDLEQNDSSIEMDMEEDEDDSAINVKDEGDHMVVEIKKTKEFMISNPEINPEEKFDMTNSEESESETTYMELSTVDPLAIITRKDEDVPAIEKAETIINKPEPVIAKPSINEEPNEAANILRRAEEVKRKVNQPTSDTTVESKKERPPKTENASDKSLRLLEKELQELKRTTRNEQPKTPGKTAEMMRSNRRPQLHSSTPKLSRSTEDRKIKPSMVEKKYPERRAVKENKEPKDSKETKALPVSVKEKKDVKVSSPVVREEKEAKEVETPKNTVIKNGNADKSADESIRRSTRPSKIKDYAKMIRDRAPTMSDEDDDSDDDDEEYVEEEKLQEIRPKTRRVSGKAAPKIAKTPPTPVTSVARKRGRPRKDQSFVPIKMKKDNDDDEIEKSEKESEDNTNQKEEAISSEKQLDEKTTENNETADTSTTSNTEPKPAGVLMSPTGQTLKKVPIKSLPPGVRPLPLPANARPMGQGELCEMQIGKKMVKVQKIVMTKAEVEAMAKKGLLEMKDGTMVLKQGIKIPSDPVALKSTLVGEEVGKESPIKKDKAAPTRCDIGD